MDYDALPEREQAIVRGTWDEQIADRLASLNLAWEFLADGAEWFEADDIGNLVRCGRRAE